MIPTLRMVALFGLGVPLTITALLDRRALLLAVGYSITLVVAATADALLAASPEGIQFSRALDAHWRQGEPAQVQLTSVSGGSGPLRLRVRDVLPPGIEGDSGPLLLHLPQGRRRGSVTYHALPARRGRFEIGPLAVRVRGPLGMIERQKVLSVNARVSVYPDLRPLRSVGPRASLAAAFTPGPRRVNRPGEGSDFHQLRDYLPGDDIRLMDWKAFARRGRPVVREHRPERNQRILLLLDAGRLMTIMVGSRTRFDWAVEAAGRLARSALELGDRVGLGVAGPTVQAHLPPARGAGQLRRLAESLCDARAGLHDADLSAALHQMLRRSSRRSLVVLFTDLTDARAGGRAFRIMGRLAPRHLGLVVTLADGDLEAERDRPVTDADSLFRRAAAEELWHRMRLVEEGLEGRGAIVLRARADRLAAETIQRYMEIKREGLL